MRRLPKVVYIGFSVVEKSKLKNKQMAPETEEAVQGFTCFFFLQPLNPHISKTTSMTSGPLKDLVLGS